MRKLLLALLGLILALAVVFFVLRRQPEPSGTGDQSQSPQITTISVNGTALSYVEQGKGEPVILIHGFLHDYRVWAELWPELSRRYRVIAYSRRYHYPNPWPAGPPETSPAVDSSDLAALIQTLGLGRVHLIGHSAGAGIALRVARDHPELVRSIILGEPLVESIVARSPEAASVFPPPFFAEARQAFEQGEDERALRIIAAGIVGTDSAFDEIPPDKRRILFDNLRLGKLQILHPGPPPVFTCEDAQGIQAPALLLEGERTVRMFRLAAEELHKCMPASKRALLPSATHALQLENPAGFNEIVTEFLAAHAGKTER